MAARRRSKSVKKSKPPQIAGPLVGPPPEVMVAGEAASYIRLAPSAMYEHAARADDPTRARNGSTDPIPVIRVGRVLRFRRQDLDAWLTRRLSTQPAKPVKSVAR